MVTCPPSTSVLTSDCDSVASLLSAFSICAWIVASSGGGAFASPPAGDSLAAAPGVPAAVGETEAFGEGDARDKGPSGIVCCASKVEVIGSYGRLVRKSAAKVPRAAATITLMATTPSRRRGAGARYDFGRGRLWPPVLITTRFLAGRSMLTATTYQLTSENCKSVSLA